MIFVNFVDSEYLIGVLAPTPRTQPLPPLLILSIIVELGRMFVALLRDPA